MLCSLSIAPSHTSKNGTSRPTWRKDGHRSITCCRLWKGVRIIYTSICFDVPPNYLNTAKIIICSICFTLQCRFRALLPFHQSRMQRHSRCQNHLTQTKRNCLRNPLCKLNWKRNGYVNGWRDLEQSRITDVWYNNKGKNSDVCCNKIRTLRRNVRWDRRHSLRLLIRKHFALLLIHSYLRSSDLVWFFFEIFEIFQGTPPRQLARALVCQHP